MQNIRTRRRFTKLKFGSWSSELIILKDQVYIHIICLFLSFHIFSQSFTTWVSLKYLLTWFLMMNHFILNIILTVKISSLFEFLEAKLEFLNIFCSLFVIYTCLIHVPVCLVQFFLINFLEDCLFLHLWFYWIDLLVCQL